MPWPNATLYFEAIQNPKACFADPELRQGEPAVNKMGLPILYSGNFAAVFQLRCPGNQVWGVKCFTREVPGLQQRYQAISAGLKQAQLPFMVDFQYLEKGIHVEGHWYAVLKMRWVEGLALNRFVETYLDQPKALDKLALLWVKLARELQRVGIAHGDLQHGNVLLIPADRAAHLALRLIDYDGMFVPALAQNRPPERGHPNFQHPQRQKEGTYHAGIDRFAHLVIYTALRGLAVAGRALWTPTFDDGENLLFREDDFRDPANSALFRALWELPDPDMQALTGHLILASQAPLEQVPFLPELVADRKVRPLSAEQSRQLASLVPYAASTSGSPALIRKWLSSGRRRLVLFVVFLVLAGGIIMPLMLMGKSEALPSSAVAVSASTSPETAKDSTTALERPPPSETARVFLADLTVSEKHGKFAKGDIKINKDPLPHGLSMHPDLKEDNANCAFLLKKQYRMLKGAVTLTDLPKAKFPNSVYFSVLGDGKPIWESQPVQKVGDPETFQSDITGIDKLELRVVWKGKGQHPLAVWVNPRVLK